MSKAILVAILFSCVAAAYADKGMMTSCGSNKFIGTWDPNPVMTYKNLTVMVSLIPAHNASTLTADIQVKYAGIPIVNTKQSMPCTQLPVCPIVAGKPTTEKLTLPFNYGVPQGHYQIRVNITNEMGMELLCAEIDTHVVHGSKMPFPLFNLPEFNRH